MKAGFVVFLVLMGVAMLAVSPWIGAFLIAAGAVVGLVRGLS